MKHGHEPPLPPSREEWITTIAMLVALAITILLLGHGA